jgi:hypothetical protein
MHRRSACAKQRKLSGAASVAGGFICSHPLEYIHMAKNQTRWNERPVPQYYTAALNYLMLQFPAATARRLAKKARGVKATEHIAKDLLRASNLPLLPLEERHVAENLKRIRKGKALSPIILIQGDLTRGRPLVIADGYHRMCAACHADEDSPVRGILVAP